MIRYDNRQTNLRVVTYQQNNRNKGKRSDNTSGKQGIDFQARRQEWRARICNNNNQTIQKCFSIARYGAEEAKQMAIDQLLAWQREFGYEGQ